MGREHHTYYLVAKITSFQELDSKRMLQIFYMKNRKYINYVTNITKLFKTSTIVPIKFMKNIFFCRNG